MHMTAHKLIGMLATFIKYEMASSTESVDRATFKCDSHGNVIEKIFHPDGDERPKWKTVYRIKYR
jgi:hypothetical protein